MTVLEGVSNVNCHLLLFWPLSGEHSGRSKYPQVIQRGSFYFFQTSLHSGTWMPKAPSRSKQPAPALHGGHVGSRLRAERTSYCFCLRISSVSPGFISWAGLGSLQALAWVSAPTCGPGPRGESRKGAEAPSPVLPEGQLPWDHFSSLRLPAVV